MEAFRVFSANAVGKFGRGEVLTELEQVVVYETLKVDELSHTARWARAREDFYAMRTAALLPPAKSLTGGWMSCWDVESSDEFLCMAMGEAVGSSGHAECRVMNVFTRTVSMYHSRNLTTRSPFGDFLLLKDARVGDVIFLEDDLLDGWTSMRVERIEDGCVYAKTSLETSYVANAAIAAKKMVSRTPPVWGGQRWSLNPFTREVCIYLDFFSSRIAEQSSNDVALTTPMLRTNNHVLAKREALRHRTHVPGLWSALMFLQNNPDNIPKVPGVEYATWVLSTKTWAPALCYTDAKMIPANSVPVVYPHGDAIVPTLSRENRTGWYVCPGGICVFDGSGCVRFLTYKDTIEITGLHLRLDGGVVFQFDSDEALTVLLEAYVQNAKVYASLDVSVSRVQRGSSV